MEAQKGIDAIEEIGSDHRDLVDDKSIELPVQRGIAHAHLLDFLDGDIRGQNPKNEWMVWPCTYTLPPLLAQAPPAFCRGGTETLQER